MERVFVLGDIHGAYKALVQCMERAGFDYQRDHLIFLGDVCDGWPETKHCMDELLKITHITYVLGNHDTWFLKWMETGAVENIWYVQGGEATIDSYDGKLVPKPHINLIKDALPYFHFEGRLFVHAGIDGEVPVEKQTEETFLWDRALAKKALKQTRGEEQEKKLTIYDEVYLGHTPVAASGPLHAGGVWLMDTGAGWSGVLSLMDIHTKEIFRSDSVPSLYPGVKGRSKG